MIDIDTTKMLTCGEDIIKLSEDLDVVLQDMIKDINKIVSNNIWNGLAAEKFISKFNFEINDLLLFKNNLYQYGKILKQNSKNYDDLAKKI